MISIILPTRGRPKLFKRMCLSVLESTSDPKDIEFVSYRDNDDPSIYEYFGNHKEVVGDRINYSQTFNECYKIAAGPIYMFAADDIVFYTKEWDKYVKEAFDQSADKIIFVYPNDRYARSNHGVVGFLHKNWIDTVGYFTPPYFAAWFTDYWINDVAIKINRRVYLHPVIVKEVGTKGNNRQIPDKTHKEYMKRRDKNNCKEIYRLKEAERESNARLLQNFINNFKIT